MIEPGAPRRRDRLRPGHPHHRPRPRSAAPNTALRYDRVLRALQRVADGNGRCTMGGRELAEITGLTPKSCRVAVLALQRLGKLTKVGSGEFPLIILAARTERDQDGH